MINLLTSSGTSIHYITSSVNKITRKSIINTWFLSVLSMKRWEQLFTTPLQCRSLKVWYNSSGCHLNYTIFMQLLPWGGKITSESMKFFSPIVIWTKFPPSEQKHHLLFSAFKDYLKVDIDLVNALDKVTSLMCCLMQSVTRILSNSTFDFLFRPSLFLRYSHGLNWWTRHQRKLMFLESWSTLKHSTSISPGELKRLVKLFPVLLLPTCSTHYFGSRKFSVFDQHCVHSSS